MNPEEVQPRRFRHDRVLRITHTAYQRAIELLATTANREPATAIIGIANGGRAPAQSLHRHLHIPHYLINARHNPTDAIYTQTTGHVTLDLQPLLTGLAGRRLHGTILVVDDICGSGATFRAVLQAIAPEAPDLKIRTVALCRNDAATFDPDLWIWTVDDWVSFPWEPMPADGTPVEDLTAPESVMTP